MWVKTPEGRLAFLLPENNGDPTPFIWNKTKFDNCQRTRPNYMVMVRLSGGALRTIKIRRLVFDSEAVRK